MPTWAVIFSSESHLFCFFWCYGRAPPLVSGAGAPPLFGAGGVLSALGLGTGSSQALVNVILEQQRLLEQAGVRPVAQPAPAFQVFSHQQQLAAQALPVDTNPSLRLGAQLAQLQLHREPQNRVDVLQANQLAMQVSQLGMLRQNQLAAAEKKVVLFMSLSTLSSSHKV